MYFVYLDFLMSTWISFIGFVFFLGDLIYIVLVALKFFLDFIYLFYYYLFLAALDLSCCAWFFASCGNGGTRVAVCGLLIAVAFLFAEHRLWGLSSCSMRTRACRLSTCGAQA